MSSYRSSVNLQCCCFQFRVNRHWTFWKLKTMEYAKKSYFVTKSNKFNQKLSRILIILLWHNCFFIQNEWSKFPCNLKISNPPQSVLCFVVPGKMKNFSTFSVTSSWSRVCWSWNYLLAKFLSHQTQSDREKSF